MYHIPNEGKRSMISGAVLKSMGLKRGVPDICLPVPRGGYGALYIEMKSENGVLSQDQKKFINSLRQAGNAVKVCRSWYDAMNVIVRYLEGEKKMWGSDCDYSNAANCDKCYKVARDFVKDVDYELWLYMAKLPCNSTGYHIYISEEFYKEISDSRFFHCHTDFSKNKKGETKMYYLWFPVHISEFPGGANLTFKNSDLL